MFPYLQVVAFGKLLSTCFDVYVTYRQHRNHHHSVEQPLRVSKLITTKTFQDSQKYCYAKSSFQLFITVLECIVELLLMLNLYASRVWNACEKWSNGSQMKQTIFFAIITGFVSLLLDMPSTLYSTFVLEQRFGFNRTTIKTYIIDMLKQIFLSMCLGIPMIMALYKVLEFVSVYDPIIIAVLLFTFMASFSIFMMLLYPTVIAPMFNQFTPFPEGTLKNKLVAMASKMNFPLSKIYVIDGSRRSSHSNAFVFGLFKKYICIYDSLLEQTKDEDQVVGVLCHELGHWYHSHTVYGLFLALTQTFVYCFIYAFTNRNKQIFTSFGYHDQPYVIGLLLLSEIMTPLDNLLTPLTNYLSRRWEYQADAFAKKQRMENQLAQALVGMSISNLSNFVPDPLYSTWNYSHPTLLERLDALQVSPTISASQTTSKKQD